VTMPPKLALVIVGVAAVAAVAAIGAAVTATEPIAEEPAPTDQAMVVEAQQDPTAVELDEAQEAEAAVEELQPDIDELSSELDDFESKVEALAKRAEKASTKAQDDKRVVSKAKDKVDSLG